MSGVHRTKVLEKGFLSVEGFGTLDQLSKNLEGDEVRWCTRPQSGEQLTIRTQRSDWTAQRSN